MLAAALLPAVLLFLFIWKKDPQKEPMAWLLKAVGWGALMCVPAAFVEEGLEMALFGRAEPTTLFGTTVEAFLVAAVPEEAVKLLALWMVVRKNPFFDEHVDGIVYAVCVGLGFAAVENVFYVLGEEENWMGVAVARSLLAVPAHYAFAVLMGYYYSIYHFVDRSRKVAVRIFLVPVVAHGIYDGILMGATVNPLIAAVSTLAVIWFCVKMHRHAYRRIVEQIERDNNEKDGSAFFNSLSL